MSGALYPPNSGQGNLTLTELELNQCRPVRSGRSLRAFCPFHGSDRQRSLRLDLESGRFQCFACGAWGYTEEARQRWTDSHAALTKANSPKTGYSSMPSSSSKSVRPDGHTTNRISTRKFDPLKSKSVRPDGYKSTLSSFTALTMPYPKNEQSALENLPELWLSYREVLPGSPGELYLEKRGIPRETAIRYGVGYASYGKWAHRARDWQDGRLVFPHTDPDGRLINFYGRAVGGENVPKAVRHDHLPGMKGYFNARALRDGEGPLFIAEGTFDALSLIAAGYPRTVAIFGVNGWRWDWLGRKVRQLVFALDADSAGQHSWRSLAREARLRGKEVAFLPPEAYGGHKDLNEAWVAGVLKVGEWPANEQSSASHDPRPDLDADSQLWEKLLVRVAEEHSKELYGALHGLRCSGGAIAEYDGRFRLVEGKAGPDLFRQWQAEYLQLFEEVLDYLLDNLSDD